MVYVHIVERTDFGLPKDKILGFFIQNVLVGRLMRKGQSVRLCAKEVVFYPFPLTTAIGLLFEGRRLGQIVKYFQIVGL